MTELWNYVLTGIAGAALGALVVSAVSAWVHRRAVSLVHGPRTDERRRLLTSALREQGHVSILSGVVLFFCGVSMIVTDETSMVKLWLVLAALAFNLPTILASRAWREELKALTPKDDE